MTNGFCDIPDCNGKTCMGWRPLTEPRGRQICKIHRDRHNNKADSFNLFKTFGFAYPELLDRTQEPAEPEEQIGLCDCGAALSGKQRFCSACAAEKERIRKKGYARAKAKGEIVEHLHHCIGCGKKKAKQGHIYCRRCSETAKRTANRNRQDRHRRKHLLKRSM